MNNWEKFGRSILEFWLDGSPDIDMFDVQALAEAAGVLVPVPGGFDPEKHDDTNGICEPGDDWFEIIKREPADPAKDGA